MRIKSFFIVIVALAAVLPLGAQSFQESLFLNTFRMGFRYNPALASDTGFVSVGGLSFSEVNNVGAAAFIYPKGGKPVTGLHPSVSADEFLSSLKDSNVMRGHAGYNLFSYGFSSGAAFHTLEINARGEAGLSVPKDFFRLFKQGGEDLFSLAGMSVQSRLYAELAYGYSRKIGDRMRLGARTKLLLGLSAADYTFQRFDLQVNSEYYQADLQLQRDRTKRLALPDGAGLAVDLGLVWELADGLQLAASMTDLGGLFWYYGNASQATGRYTFTGLTEMAYEDMNLSGLWDQAKSLVERFKEKIVLRPEERRTACEILPFRVNGGLRYDMPFYRALSAGITGNYTAYKGLPYWEGRIDLAVNPVDWLDLCVNAGIGAYGPVWGTAVQLSVHRFRLYAGLEDGCGGTLPHRGLPLQANVLSLVVGLTCDL
jgi:hypothetical protein